MVSLRALSKHVNTSRRYFCTVFLARNLLLGYLLWESKSVPSLVCSSFQNILDASTVLSYLSKKIWSMC